MKYMGSKNRIAKEILPIMLKERGQRTWVEPFVGGANMIDKVQGKRIGADLNEYVIALLNEMSKPTFVAPVISEEKYNELKSNKGVYEKWVVGYAGTQLSFGATWFGSYRRDNLGKRNYCLEAQTNVNKQSKNLQGVEFIHSSYDSLEVPENSFIYCDPPYQTEATKGKYKDDFNHERFWQWCRDMATKGHIVYVSEYNAPADFESVWQKEINQRMNNNVETSKAVEKLFKFSPTNVQ
jgi:DNA adenine methylase